MTKKLNIADITRFPLKTEILDNTPAAGDTTIYTAYGDPTKEGNLNEIVIQRTVILADSPAVGDTDITDQWATTALADQDQLSFNKRWSLRASYSYKYLKY
jgi:hypothetical protein